MIVDLVQATTRDGVRLDGSFQVPPAESINALPVDCCLFVHGTGGSFYSAALFDPYCARLLELGCSSLRINTRGHDLMSTAATTRGGRRQGAAYELVHECRHDLIAWSDWLTRRGYSRIALIGHSLGAVKAIYAMANEPIAGVVCLVAVSPPRLSHSHFNSSDRAVEFRETFAAADSHVRAGRADTLMEVQVPLPFVVTAAGYVEKYGPDEQYNFLNFISKLRLPSLILFGGSELENNMAFRGLPELLEPIAASATNLQIDIIPGADHFYSSHRPDLVARTERWLRTVQPV